MGNLAQSIIKRYRRTVLRDPFLLNVKRWKRDNGDQGLRLDYDLDETSVVVDVGGYVGDFASAIFEKFGCKVLVFEPMPRFYQACLDRFAENDSVTIFDYGLGARDEKLRICDTDDGSSFFREESADAEIVAEIRDISSVWSELGLEHVDLVKMNIEGGEYPLLERMLETGLTEHVSDIQVQFHNFVESATARRDAIRAKLAGTHNEQWCYEFVWENWTAKNRAA